jgi:hypothetical protein
VNRVEGISAEFTITIKAQLDLLKEGNFGSPLSRAGLGQELLEAAAAVFIWTAVVDRSKWKYRERAYRYIYMDVGHIGQNLYLAASALNLGCCTVGAFFDEEVDDIVGVDGREEISVYMGAVGKAGCHQFSGSPPDGPLLSFDHGIFSGMNRNPIMWGVGWVRKPSQAKSRVRLNVRMVMFVLCYPSGF